MMKNRGDFNLNYKKRTNKTLTAVVSVIVLLLAALFVIGLTAGKNSTSSERIAAAIEENTQLKQDVAELRAQIERMQQEIDELNINLEARPTVAPVQYALPAVTPEPQGNNQISPRGAR